MDNVFLMLQVSEYLKITELVDDVGNNSKIRTNFERANQKTNISIGVLQKKLEKYQLQAKHLEQGVQGSRNIIRQVIPRTFEFFGKFLFSVFILKARGLSV